MAGRINNLFIPVGVPGSDRMLWSGLTGPGPAGFSRLSSSVLYFLEPSGQLCVLLLLPFPLLELKPKDGFQAQLCGDIF